MLKLCRRKAIALLKTIGQDIINSCNYDISIDFDRHTAVGFAELKEISLNGLEMTVGTGNLSGFFRFPFSKVKDLTFTRAVVSMFHEYGHILQFSNDDLYTAVSSISTYHNPTYYLNNYTQLPHEINAEAVGVSLAWDFMEFHFSEDGNQCMLDYINTRTKESYMIPYKNDGYRDRIEVEEAFVLSMEKSLNSKREVFRGFLDNDDESIKLLLQGVFHRNYEESPNAYHINKLLDNDMVGYERDRCMAALVLYLHPNLVDRYPILENEYLTVESEFNDVYLSNHIFDLSKQTYCSFV